MNDTHDNTFWATQTAQSDTTIIARAQPTGNPARKNRGGFMILPEPEKEMETVYFSLGSNLGDRAGNIARAIAMLGERVVCVKRQSSLYETEPVDLRDGGWFLNCAIEAETELSPEELMRVLLEVERILGRKRAANTNLKESRTMDIDILLYGSRIVHEPGVEIPHPRMAERKFVLAPLAEIAPKVCHPILKRTIEDLLAATSDRSEVRPFSR